MQVYLPGIAGSKPYISIKNPFNWCTATAEIYDENDALKYTLKTYCCSCAYICPMKCGRCKQATMTIESANGDIG